MKEVASLIEQLSISRYIRNICVELSWVRQMFFFWGRYIEVNYVLVRISFVKSIKQANYTESSGDCLHLIGLRISQE